MQLASYMYTVTAKWRLLLYPCAILPLYILTIPVNNTVYEATVIQVSPEAEIFPMGNTSIYGTSMFKTIFVVTEKSHDF